MRLIMHERRDCRAHREVETGGGGEFQVWCLERITTAVRNGLDISPPFKGVTHRRSLPLVKFVVVELSLPSILNEQSTFCELV